MSKNLHSSIIEFFRTRMSEHNRVSSFTDISTDEFVIYKIDRKNMPSVVVYLSDAYKFTYGEFLARPSNPKIDYVLMARPEATDDHPSSENWQGVGVGNIAGFMGALNKPAVSTYSPPAKS